MARFDGLPGDDTLPGTAADDDFYGSAGNDVIIGGGGFDALRYQDFTTAVTITISGTSGGATGTVSKASGTDSFSNIDFFTGSQVADILQVTATAAPEVVYLYGGGGADTLIGNGLIRVYATYGQTTATTPVVADLAAGTAAFGGATDHLVNIRSVTGGRGNDRLYGDDNDNRLGGREGNNIVDGRGGFDTLLSQDLGAVVVRLTGVGAGTLTTTLTAGGTARTTFSNVEEVVGSQLADSFLGNTGSDRFAPGGGADRVDGGAGYDYVDYGWLFSTRGVVVDLAAGTATDSQGTIDQLLSIEAALGTPNADDLTGLTATFDGSRSLLRGLAGADTIRAATAGLIATADYQDAGTTGILADLRNPARTIVRDGYGNTDTLINIRSIRGSDFADTLLGGAADERLDGDLGNDSVNGGAGNDRLQGGGGGDTLLGGEGNDTLEPGSGTDVVDGGVGGFDQLLGGALGAADFVLSGRGAGTLTVALSAGGTATTSFTNTEDFVGGAGADRFTGSAFGEFFSPGGGNDTGLDGGAGYDWLSYRYGSDATAGAVVNLFGGSASDGQGGTDGFVNFEAVSGTQFADDLRGIVLGGTEGSRLRGNEGNDTLRGFGGDATIIADYRNPSLPGVQGIRANLTNAVDLTVVDTYGNIDRLFDIRSVSGSDFSDTMFGGVAGERFFGQLGNDSLNSGAGDDTLVGGFGADTLVGGTGLDVMRFFSAAEGGDRIIGYVSGDDDLQVSAAGFGGGLMAGSLLGGGQYEANDTGMATSAQGRFIYERDARVLWWDVDGTGATARVLIAETPNTLLVAATDIIVIA